MTNLSFPPARSQLLKRLRENPDYMAYVLARYQEQEGISDENLAAALGTLPHLAIRLALCRKPDAGATNFAARVREIADYTLMDESVLANIIRQVSSLQALSTAPERQLLSAARDRGDAGPDRESPAETNKPEGKS
jgi:hypothetical protein